MNQPQPQQQQSEGIEMKYLLGEYVKQTNALLEENLYLRAQLAKLDHQKRQDLAEAEAAAQPETDKEPVVK